MHLLTCLHQFVLLTFLHNNKNNMNSNKTNVERNAKRKPTKCQHCLEHSAKTYHKVIINVSNCSLHGRRNRVAQGARALTFSQICMKCSLFSANIALSACETASECMCPHLFNASYVPCSLGIFGQAWGSFYSKCAKIYALRNPALNA